MCRVILGFFCMIVLYCLGFLYYVKKITMVNVVRSFLACSSNKRICMKY